MERKNSKVTIDVVAKHAGVAKSTVSRILNNSGSVKPETRIKVNRVIEELGFKPNMMARSLKTNLRKQIALAIDDIRNPYYPELAWAAEQVVKQHGYRLVLINHYGNPSEELSVIRESNEMHVDGVILLSISFPKALKQAIKKANIPVCLIGYPEDEEVAADVVNLSRSEGQLAMDHLIRIGRTRIAYVGGPIHMHSGTRYAAYEKALTENFMEIDPALIYIGEDFSMQIGIQAAAHFRDRGIMPDAVYAANDMIAIGLIQALKETNYRVPEDIAVIGIDDIKWCTIMSPQVSSVSNLSTEMARIAVELLLKRISNKGEYKQVHLEPRLVVRESTVKLSE